MEVSNRTVVRTSCRNRYREDLHSTRRGDGNADMSKTLRMKAFLFSFRFIFFEKDFCLLP